MLGRRELGERLQHLMYTKFKNKTPIEGCEFEEYLFFLP